MVISSNQRVQRHVAIGRTGEKSVYILRSDFNISVPCMFPWNVMNIECKQILNAFNGTVNVCGHSKTLFLLLRHISEFVFM